MIKCELHTSCRVGIILGLYSSDGFMKLTSGQIKTLKAIVHLICERGMLKGARLFESSLAEIIGISRTPVRVVLDYLACKKVVEYEKGKGYTLLVSYKTIPDSIIEEIRQPEDPLYARFARARLAGELGGSVTEAEVMRRFSATRAGVRKVLTQAQREGWAVKEAGYGVRFLPIIDSHDAYDDMYRLRLALEPAGVLSPKFKADLSELRSLRDEQKAILSEGYSSLSQSERFESNARFHETIMSWSHNQMALQVLRNLYQMRRLAEYEQESRAQSRQLHVPYDHLNILDAIEEGDTVTAASLLRQHISRAIANKVDSAAEGNIV